MRILKANSTLEPQLLEYIGSGSWRVRWNILSTDDGYSYTEADLNYNPSIEEIKDIISNWVRDSYKADSFYIDEHNFWLSDSERATIKSQCEFSSTTITCICKEKVITLDSSTALQMVYMMDSYANSCKESVELVVNKLASCSTLEEMNEAVKSIELPEVIYTTQEELIKLANSREKNSKSIRQFYLLK